VFIRSAITPPKVNRFGWNLEHSEYIVGGWPWQILGAVRAVARVGQRVEFLFFCQVSNARFHWFPSAKFSEICTQHVDSAEYWIHFTARFDGVHMLDYNSTESKLIWMKSGALWVHCRGLAMADFGRNPHSSKSGRTSPIFVFFCQVSNARFHRFTSAKFPEICTQQINRCRGENFRNGILQIFEK